MTATFRLVQLGSPGRGEAISPGATIELGSGVRLTLVDAAGNAMVERQAEATVTIDGQAVYEVAHGRALQEVKVEGRVYVLIPPFGIYVHGLGARTAAEAGEVDGARSDEEGGARADGAGRRGPSRLRLVGGAILVATLSVGTTLAFTSVESAAPSRAAGATSGKPVAPPAAAGSGAAGAAAAATPTAAAPTAAAPTAAPAAAAALAGSVEVAPAASPTPAPAVAFAPVAPAPPSAHASPTPRIPSPAPRQGKTRMHPHARTDRVPAASIPDAKERALRTTIESYQLEAGYDPEGAARKLKELKRSLPADDRLQQDIDRALRSIGM